MALINCPECGKEISDKAEICINCGYPIKNGFLEEDCINDFNIVNGITVDMRKIMTGSEIDSIINLRNATNCSLKEARTVVLNYYNNSTIGVIRKRFGKSEKVKCIKCFSFNCSHYQEQVYIPEKTKTRLTVNLNPFRPFTIANAKEKVVRQAKTITKEKFICNECGKIFS